MAGGLLYIYGVMTSRIGTTATRTIAPLAAAAALLAACASAPTPREVAQVTPDDLLEASPLVAGSRLPDVSGTDILALSPRMADFVDARVEPRGSPRVRLQQLLHAVMEEGTFELVYEEATRTAAETFDEQGGNCLSFTNMFVAMARHAGLDASYQEVDIPPDWSFQGQTFLFSQHVNVFVDLGIYRPRIVDFNESYEYQFDPESDRFYDRKVISDARARAHYFNNIGAEYMLLQDDTPMAFTHFRQSIREDPSFGPAWINLGILHRRDEYRAHAEAAWLRALEVEPGNLIAMSNLASLHEEAGRLELAEQYRSQVRSHRMSNPYYRYHLAQEDVIGGAYESAREHLRYAIRHRENESRFYFLMGLSYAMSGDRAQAAEWLSRADEIAAENERIRYHHKLEMLQDLTGG